MSSSNITNEDLKILFDNEKCKFNGLKILKLNKCFKITPKGFAKLINNINKLQLNEMNFTVYSKEDCPYCYKVKQVLELTGSKFVVYTLEQDFTKEEFYAEFGEGTTFPQVICDSKKFLI